MAVSAIVTVAGHGATVAWPALSGRMTGLITLVAVGLAMGAFSLYRRRLADAVAIASGAALGPVVVFILANWLISGGMLMPAGWLLLLPLVLLSAFVPAALVAALIGRWLRRNGP
ncbi:MAG: hypothetical protein KDA22_05595 [Phycisphaerales bacterium]|nr:hypothetical protein [Phycisphaerales bacterium]